MRETSFKPGPHQNLAAPNEKKIVNSDNPHSSTFIMAKKQQYDTPHRSKVQGLHEFLVAKGIEHDERDIFEFFSVTQRSGYRMIEPGTPSRTYANSGALETRGRKGKVTSEQVREVDAILQDDVLGLEGKALTWDQLATEVGADVCGRTMHKIMSDALDYGKHLACIAQRDGGALYVLRDIRSRGNVRDQIDAR